MLIDAVGRMSISNDGFDSSNDFVRGVEARPTILAPAIHHAKINFERDNIMSEKFFTVPTLNSILIVPKYSILGDG